MERVGLVYARRKKLSCGVDEQKRSGGRRRLSVVLSSLLRPQQGVCGIGIEDQLITSGDLLWVKECGS
jgi:hypothetical protein